VGNSVLEGEIVWSAEGAALIGLSAVEQRQTFADYAAMIHPDDRQRLVHRMQRAVDACGEYHLGYRIRRPDGAVVWVDSHAVTVCLDGAPVRTLGLIWDDSDRRHYEARLFKQKELAEVTLGSIGDAVVTADAAGCVRFMNRAAEQLTGWDSAEARGLAASQVVRVADEATGQEIECPIARSLRLRHGVNISNHAQLITREGHRVAIEDSAAPIRSREGDILGAVVVFRDVSHERALTHQLGWQASHDALTGLANRRAFETAVAGALRTAKDEGHRHALLYMDLDRFKIVNDTCGHGAGDVLLQTLTRLLQAHMRESDMLARLGGDEFGALLAFCPPARALRLADELRQTVKDFRFVWGDRVFELGVSVGMVEIDEDSKSTGELLVAADQACYAAKESGRNRVNVYRESDAAVARRQGEMQWIACLNEALAQDLFSLYSQPIVPLHGGDGGHREVLVRIRSAQKGLILPGAFIPAAERYDLMVSLDRWVVTHVCRHIHAELAEAGQPPPMYSVNLSGMSLGDDGMLDHIMAEFDENGIDPTRLCFEITETAVIANLAKAQAFIARLRALGCRFSLDDFGSGLSSFAYLRSLHVDYLKIDGAFIRDIVRNDIDRALVKAINEVGHVMGIRTIAEYVEDQPTLDAVGALGIDYAQGYAVGRESVLA
jgi:diguanylate cyclase (GGDEF)-like protein/PAS domain S-box-containing protein